MWNDITFSKLTRKWEWKGAHCNAKQGTKGGKQWKAVMNAGLSCKFYMIFPVTGKNSNTWKNSKITTTQIFHAWFLVYPVPHSRMGHYFFSYLLTWEVDLRTQQDSTRLNKTQQDSTRICKTRQDLVKLGKTWQEYATTGGHRLNYFLVLFSIKQP